MRGTHHDGERGNHRGGDQQDRDNTGVAPAFDSGGLGPGQSFVWTPVAAGVDGYHSSTDASYVTEPVCNCNAPSYGAFAGTVTVGQ